MLLAMSERAGIDACLPRVASIDPSLASPLRVERVDPPPPQTRWESLFGSRHWVSRTPGTVEVEDQILTTP